MSNRNKLFTCIVFFPDELARRPRKYRNINNISRFERFAEKEEALYFNVYSKKTNEFIQRVYTNKKAGQAG
ncbi:hypothetical protein BC659_0488 [Sediminibacterium goheungense]|uniref:Uncharacterized protein n=1 Tax=Sediminibacterium goheungense TaxID=1086393 RepID=A0A4R6IZX4_9BACT|nr:hypothetical protein BC659_0488 [Sediminibacterium goheungense]